MWKTMWKTMWKIALNYEQKFIFNSQNNIDYYP